ncbi:MAG: hypothetical protein KAZ88_11635 [Acidimicrobiia bacterium]|jgi:hypothetical protein|nr:hypothetical protein [Acidimicrobiia bacterium]
MKHSVIEALAKTGREVGPRAVAVLVAMVEMAELGDDALTIAGGCREVAAATLMSRSSANDEMKKLIAAGLIERFSAGSTSVCVIRPRSLGLAAAPTELEPNRLVPASPHQAESSSSANAA